jgi:hypothetical protein
MYLDGEATPLQQEVLFSQLANNQELRQEFTDAISMGKVFRLERSSVKAPLYLRSKVFANAGIPIHDVELADAAAGTVAAGTAWYALRRFVLPVTTLFIGALATYAALTFGSINGSTTGSTIGSTNASGAGTSTSKAGSGMPVAPASVVASRNIASLATEQEVSREINREVIREINQEADPTPKTNILAASESVIANSSLEAERNVAAENTNIDSQNDGALYAQSTAYSGAYILPAAYALQPGSAELRRADAVQAGFVGTASSLFTVQGNRLFNANLLGSTGVSAPIANPSVALMYNIDHQLSVGVSYGRTTFSFSDVSSTGVVLDNPRFTMISAEAQWLSEEPVAFDSKLFSRAAVGVAGLSGSMFGSGSFTVGLHIPVSIFTIQPGVSLEGVAVNSRLGSPLHTRVSFVTGIGVGL